MKTNKMRWTYPLWVKLLLAFFCAVALIVLTLSSVGTVIFHTLPDYEEELDAKFENVAMNYSAHVLQQIHDGSTAEEVQDQMQNTAPNFRYAVVASSEEDLDDVDLSDSEVWLVGSSGDQDHSRWTFEGKSNQVYYYSLQNVFASSLGSNYAYGYCEEAPLEAREYQIENILYNTDNGLFYLETEAGLYPVEQVNLTIKTEITEDMLQSLTDEGYLTLDADSAAGEKIISAENDNNALLQQQLLTIYNAIATDGTANGNKLYGFANITGILDENENGYDYERSDDESASLITPGSWNLDTMALQDWESVSMVDSNYHVSQALSRGTDGPITEQSLAAAGSILSGSDAEWEDDSDMSRVILALAEPDPIHYWVFSWTADPLDEEADDLFAQWNQVLPAIYELGEFCLPMQILSLILLILGILFLAFGIGHRITDTEIHIRFWEKIPYLIWIGVLLTLEPVAIMCMEFLIEAADEISFINTIVFAFELAMAAILLGEAFVATTIVRIKARCFRRYTVCHYLAIPFKALKEQIKTNLPLFWKVLIILSGWSFLEIVVVMLSWTSWSRHAQFFWLLLLLIVQSAALLVVAMQMVRLYDASKKIAAGDIDHPVDTSKLYWKFKEHGENLNHISVAIESAVQKEMKSEHFQTELITNVSHDIKTPLTSIINYVDLIKKEDITDPKLSGYIEVLDRQSSKLKKLIEDLMEASKASTGNITVNMEETDAAILLEQAVGEFSERLERSGLHVFVTSPEPPVTIIADGRHLWRVFDNLLSNICKYSMEGTRVYINLTQDAGGTDIIFRNISANELNISSEELMARFVRGDASRNTEGSGLGLNIAQSLMRLMNGSLKLDVDGDLFKVTLHFSR